MSDQDDRSSQSNLFGNMNLPLLFHGEDTGESDRVKISRQGGSHHFHKGLGKHDLAASDSLDAGRDEYAL